MIVKWVILRYFRCIQGIYIYLSHEFSVVSVATGECWKFSRHIKGPAKLITASKRSKININNHLVQTYVLYALNECNELNCNKKRRIKSNLQI